MEATFTHNFKSTSPYQLGWVLLGIFTVILFRGILSPLFRIPGPWYTNWTGLVYKYETIKGRGPDYVHTLHKRYGPVVRVAPGSVDFADAEAVRQIHTVKADYVKTDFYNNLPPDKISLFTTTDRETHRRHRKLLSQPMSENGLKSMMPQIEEKVSLAIERMRDEMKTRGAVDVFKWWMFMATDVIGQLSFGDSFHMLETGKKNKYIEDLEGAGFSGTVTTQFPILYQLVSIIPLPAVRAAKAINSRLSAYANQSLERYRAQVKSSAEVKPMLFTRLMEGFTDGESISQLEIVNNAELYIVAGSDTTATTLTYLTWSLCRHPEIKSRLLKELESLPDDFTDNHLKDLPFLNKCITETLRRYPVVPAGLPRYVPSGGAVIKGYWLPGGSVVTTQNWSLHRDPKIFPDPDRFNPSRWDKPTKGMKDVFMPFGGGSRICIGMHLAFIEIRLGIARFFREFPQSKVSTLEDMNDKEMKQLLFFISGPKSHRCLIEAR
ncbi:cytochrome P450 [Camillea tinctor]|nr:cytochrome P450 [Camillea tinctor]